MKQELNYLINCISTLSYTMNHKMPMAGAGTEKTHILVLPQQLITILIDPESFMALSH